MSGRPSEADRPGGARRGCSRRASRGASVLVLAVRGYQAVLGPWLGGRCRFYPSCSEYAVDALTERGAVVGAWLTIRRLLRCHPLGGSGIDLVPEAPGARALGPGGGVKAAAAPTDRAGSGA